MKSKLINQNPRTYAVVFQTGEEVAALLRQFAQEQGLEGSHFTGIGALSDVTLGYFNFVRKDYDQITLNEQVEVLSLLGNIAIEKNAPKIHAHIVVGKADATAHGGHLIEARVRPTLEVVIEESPRHLRRKLNPEVGLALIDLDDAG
ncbi:MAG TPA: PPC domain-containing DNA-binding protein [Verrucomicrobiae bacterium]|nr:PPC domain-containing DNA-binding protein [Verrucomicrobiae bacterium]